MNLLDVMQYAGAVLGIGGSALVSQCSTSVRFYGFCAWIVSNIALVIWSLGTGSWGILAMQCVFTITSIWGAWNHRPQVAKGLLEK